MPLIVCVRCFAGESQVNGWHYYGNAWLGEHYRIPCQLYPPELENTRPIEAWHPEDAR